MGDDDKTPPPESMGGVQVTPTGVTIPTTVLIALVVGVIGTGTASGLGAFDNSVNEAQIEKLSEQLDELEDHQQANAVKLERVGDTLDTVLRIVERQHPRQP